MIEISITNILELPQAASQIIKSFNNKNIIAFWGGMGVGKTTLIKEIAKQLGVQKNVTSPTFALVNEYLCENNQIIYHFDLYRINKVSELYDFGYEDYFYSNNYCFIEWPEIAEHLLPANYLKVEIFDIGNGTRKIKVFD